MKKFSFIKRFLFFVITMNVQSIPEEQICSFSKMCSLAERIELLSGNRSYSMMLDLSLKIFLGSKSHLMSSELMSIYSSIDDRTEKIFIKFMFDHDLLIRNHLSMNKNTDYLNQYMDASFDKRSREVADYFIKTVYSSNFDLIVNESSLRGLCIISKYFSTFKL